MLFFSMLTVSFSGKVLGTFDEQSGQLVESPINLEKFTDVNKWHHITVTVENNDDGL